MRTATESVRRAIARAEGTGAFWDSQDLLLVAIDNEIAKMRLLSIKKRERSARRESLKGNESLVLRSVSAASRKSTLMVAILSLSAHIQVLKTSANLQCANSRYVAYFPFASLCYPD